MTISHISQLFQEIPVNDDRKTVSLEFFHGLVFNVLSASTDAHGKNYSLVLDGTSVQLAHLYDLSSSITFPQLALTSAMTINGKTQLKEIRDGDLLAEAKRLKIDQAVATETIQRFRSNLLDAFDQARIKLLLDIDSKTARKITSDLLDGLNSFAEI